MNAARLPPIRRLGLLNRTPRRPSSLARTPSPLPLSIFFRIRLALVLIFTVLTTLGITHIHIRVLLLARERFGVRAALALGRHAELLGEEVRCFSDASGFAARGGARRGRGLLW
jgi:hypothetical protein